MNPKGRLAILKALSETILPTDDRPGATEARVAEYLEALMEGFSAQDLARFESGLDLVDSIAREHHGKPFDGCDGAERSEVLQSLQKVPHRIVRRFFSNLIGLVIEGFLCAPSHGGNHAGAGWRAIGYSPELPS